METIDEWTETLEIPLLSEYGVRDSDLERIVQGAGNKNNPVRLNEEEIKDLLLMRL
jgi:alcohol dehydrogenase class IV